jgi:MoxR-like ATPase
LGYPSVEEEFRMLQMLERSHPLDTLTPVSTANELLACQEAIKEVFVDAKVRNYILEIVHDTRHHGDLVLGGSPRASIALFRTSQAMAAIRGRDFVQPDDVKRVAAPVLAHRLMVKPESRLRKITEDAIVESILSEIAVPLIGTADSSNLG